MRSYLSTHRRAHPCTHRQAQVGIVGLAGGGCILTPLCAFSQVPVLLGLRSLWESSYCGAEGEAEPRGLAALGCSQPGGEVERPEPEAGAQ